MSAAQATTAYEQIGDQPLAGLHILISPTRRIKTARGSGRTPSLRRLARIRRRQWRKRKH